ncbi:16S rRNA (uracil(1498)-N(3))-methyltransferase [Metabacillus arenae]|uniref:Ribosomal RNA small subunit methyltransferase E n=1 Tax=Metabacillus arenae TaxID=2771434 RepID=A0A926NEM8_9BACI|nr:16S rRNA (uracil(1498)-N(3))-methyltransferase [Metabacillus arenae]MBD1382094.1 16S rRNA (uracil(1498)-N(3))-methyltransferase [Metabacillus arenae]
MQRYFVNQVKSDTVDKMTITGEDVHHISTVMRMSPGDTIICCSKDEHSAICEITEISNSQVSCQIIEWLGTTNELPIKVTIASGLPKGDKLEIVIQKGTELGAYKFIPFNAARSVVKVDQKKEKKKMARWQKIAKEAAEQSHRNVLPEVVSIKSFNELLREGEHYDVRLIAYENSAKQGEKNRLVSALEGMRAGQSLLIVFGPEGGIAKQEVTNLENAGFIACGLGPRILRTETAPLYALSAVSYYFELLR